MSKSKRLPQYPRPLHREPSRKDLIEQALQRQKRRHEPEPESTRPEPPLLKADW